MIKRLLHLLICCAALVTLHAAAAPAATPFDPAQATQAYIDSLGAGALQRSNTYFEGGYWLQLWRFLYGICVAFILLSTRLSTWMRDLAAKASRFRVVHDLLYLVQYFIITAVLIFPLTIYQDYFREHAYGLSNLTLSGWMTEQVKSLLVDILFGSLALAAVYAVIRKAGHNWVIWGSVVSLIFLTFMVVISPVFVAPLFNHYKPLDEGPLKASLLSMARANGIPVTNIYQFDASKQSKRISANVSGLLGTTRISLNDNLLERGNPATIKAVMAHEMGHYVLHHSYTLLLSFGVILLIGLHFLRWGFERFNRPRWGIKNVGDIAGLPLLLMLFSIYLFALTPLMNTITRTTEAEADLFGINASREPEGFAAGILSLSQYRKMKPGKWEEFIFYDHPSGYNRIFAAMRWRAENPYYEAARLPSRLQIPAPDTEI